MPTKWKVHKNQTIGRIDSRHKIYDARRMAHPELGPVARFRGSSRWQKVRARKMSLNPTCEDPFKCHAILPELARQIHHVIPLVDCLRLGQLERLGCIEGNLRSVCYACHDRIENMDMYSARRLFIDVNEEMNLMIACDVEVSKVQLLYGQVRET